MVKTVPGNIFRHLFLHWKSMHPSTHSCPCAINASPDIVVPSFIRDEYFCESGDYQWAPHSNTFYNDPLWDGDGCPERNSCCTFNNLPYFTNPPYFTKQLPASTSDDIELWDCGDQQAGIENSNIIHKTLVQFIELYVKWRHNGCNHTNILLTVDVYITGQKFFRCIFLQFTFLTS